MIRTAFAASLMLAAAPLMAQATPPASNATPQAATPTTPAQTSPTTTTTTTADPMTAPADTATTTTTAPASTGTTSTAQATTTNSDPVAATVEADWAKYDKDGNGKLSRVEFDSWMNALQTAAGKKPQTKSYLTAAFAKVDTDKSKSVSKEELTTFLKG